MADRRVVRRSAWKRSQQRRLRQCDIARRFAEVIFRSGLESVDSLAKIDLVGVQGKNLLLGKIPLDLDGRRATPPGVFGGRTAPEKETGLANCMVSVEAPCARRSSVKVSICSPGDTKEVHSPVAFKILIFDGNNRVPQNRGNVAVSNYDAALQRKRTDLVAVKCS